MAPPNYSRQKQSQKRKNIRSTFYNHHDLCYQYTMKIKTGIDKPGIPTKKKPHLGDLLLTRYKGRIMEGFEDLKRFELIDNLEKPVMGFIFYGNKKKILEVYDLLAESPYAFTIKTKKGLDLWNLPERGTRNAYVYISRFPKIIKFIKQYEGKIPDDLWGILYGYSLPKAHQFTYDWETWKKRKGRRFSY